MKIYYTEFIYKKRGMIYINYHFIQSKPINNTTEIILDSF